MITPQFAQPISDLGFEQGFESGAGSNNNYPDGFVTAKQLEKERKLNLEIIHDNGG